MKLTPMQRRAERRSRNQTMVDMNLVSLIDVFTILIFFLLSSSGTADLLVSPKAVQLPESVSDAAPRETPIVVVAGDDIFLAGRKVASVMEAMAVEGDLIMSLKSELERLPPPAQADPASPAAAKGQAITLMGDKDIPYRLLRKIMVTCARANFSDVSFAVRQREGA